MYNKIIILVGKSSSGKDTAAKYLTEYVKSNFLVSTTSRPIRDGESDRNPYNFISSEKFKKLIANNKMVEYRTYNTILNGNPDVWFYGVEKKEIKKNKTYIGVLDVDGLVAFKKEFKERVVSFFISVPDQVRKERCLNQNA